MTYALKITRDLDTNIQTVHPVIRVRSTIKPYRLVYDSGLRCAESLRLFDTRRAANTAYREEKLAAEFSAKKPEELGDILREDLALLKAEGFPLTLVCRLTDATESSVRSYLSRFNPPNPRIVAKIHLLPPLVQQFRERVQRVLPLKESCGNTRQARPYPRAKKYR